MNMNHELLFVDRFENGKHEIPIKLGRGLYIAVVEKTAIDAHVQLYKKTGGSKYDPKAELKTARISRKAVLDRRFFENLGKIADAQQTLNNFEAYL